MLYLVSRLKRLVPDSRQTEHPHYDWEALYWLCRAICAVSNWEWAVSTLVKLHVCDSLLPLLMYVLGTFFVFHCKILILFALGLTVAQILRASGSISGSSEVMEISSSMETPDVVQCLMR
jgi:hypothetical protein